MTGMQEIYSGKVRPDVGCPKGGGKETIMGYIGGIHKMLAEDNSRGLKGCKEDLDIC